MLELVGLPQSCLRLHHTFPNEIFNDANHVKKSKRAIEKLLWKGLSKLKDTVLTLVSGHRPFDFESVQHYLISTKQVIRSYEDFYEQVSNTFDLGPSMITDPKDNEYGPETNFWTKFRGYISCHHQKRLGPELGGQKIWCNPEFISAESNISSRTFVLSAGSGGDFSYEDYLTKTFSNVVIVTPDCTTFKDTQITANNKTGSSVMTIPVCLTGSDSAYLTAINPELKENFHRFPELFDALAEYFGKDFHFSLLKVNIEGFEYPLFADIFSHDSDKVLRGVKQIHIELHRQGMQAHGLNWNSLVFAELLLAHFFSGGYIPFAQEKWHDSTAAEDLAFVNQTWFIESENFAKKRILMDALSTAGQASYPLETTVKYGHDINSAGKGYYCKTGPILSPEVAKSIIAESEKTGWDKTPDLVDREAEWVIHAYYCSPENCPGWNPNLLGKTRYAAAWLMKSIEKRALKCKALGYPRIKVYWVYIKKYSRDSRVSIPIHTDNTAVTGNVMLNEEGVDFLGGEYFLLNISRTSELHPGRNVSANESYEELSERRRSIMQEAEASGEFGKWKISNPRGSGIIHFGESAHGVLNVRNGTRYCIVFFADLDDSDAAPGATS
eukprot:g10979.t1